MKKHLLLICSLILLSACSGGSSDSPTSSSSTAVNPEEQSSSSAVSSVVASSAAASESSVAYDSFTGDDVRLIGRFDTGQSGQARFTWPGTALEFLFEGTEASIAIASNDRIRFEVEVDGDAKDLWVEAGEASYTLASGLNPGVHRVRVTRLTESFSVVTRFTTDPQVDGMLMASPDAPQKRLLVLGDSITAGYGVEGDDQECSYSAETSNQQLTYAALAADALGADLHAIAWSGIGAWRSYGETTPENPTILDRYQRTLADDASSVWDTSRYHPDAILVAIGTNDYWQGSVSDGYQTAMTELVQHLQDDYPGKPVYLIVSPMLSGETRNAQESVLNSLVNDDVQVLDLGKIEAGDGFGCDYHPNKITQARSGEALTQALEADLDW